MKQKITYRLLKYFLIAIAGLVGLAGIVLAISQTRWFKDWLRARIIAESQAYLNAKVDIGRIDGNLITNTEISDILITDLGDTILYLPRLEIELTPSRLLHQEVLIDSIIIDAPYLKLVQLPDSTWNIDHLLKTTSETGEAEVSGEATNYQALLQDLRLKSAEINISALQPFIPSRIKDINIRLSAQYSEDHQEVHLKKLQLRTEEPGFDLRELSFEIINGKNQIALRDFLLRTSENRLQGSGTYFETDSLLSQAELESKPMNLSEFRAFLPSLQLYGNPTITLDTDYLNDSLSLKIQIQEQNQRFVLESGIANIKSALGDSTIDHLRYSLTGQMENVNASRWLGADTLDYLINGKFALRGSGTTPREAEFVLESNLSNCVFKGLPVKEISFAGAYKKGDLNADLNIFSNFGEMAFKSAVFEVQDTQKFDMTLDMRRFNAAVVTDTLKSDINLKIAARGQGFDVKKMRGELRAEMAASTFSDIVIDTMLALVHFEGGNYAIDTLHAVSDFAELQAKGNIGEAESDLDFLLELSDLASLSKFMAADTLQATGHLSGNLKGNSGAMAGAAQIRFNDLILDTYAVDSVNGDWSFSYSADSLAGQGHLSVVRAASPGFLLEHARVQAEFTDKFADLLVDISGRDGLAAQLQAQVVQDSTPYVVIPKIHLDLKGQSWTGGGKEMRLLWEDDTYYIENFQIAAPSAASNDEQHIRLHGSVSGNGNQNMQIRIKGLDLGQLARAFEIPAEVEGRFGLTTDITGTAAEPLLVGNTSIRDGSANQFNFRSLAGQFDYRQERLSLDLSVTPFELENFHIRGHLPVNLSPLNEGEVVLYDRPLEFQIVTAGFPLDAITASKVLITNVGGSIVCDLRVGNTVHDPRPSGFVRVRDGALTIQDYGVNYRDMQLDISVDSTRISLNKLQAKREKGMLQASGFLSFDSTLVGGKIRATNFNMVADKFFVARHQDYDIQISGDAQITGSTQSPQLGGKVTVLRSSFYLPAFMNETRTLQDEAEAMPMLISAATPPDVQIDSVATEEPTKISSQDDPTPDFYKNLRGTYEVVIPRNTWLKSPELRLEIAGDLAMIKEGPEFEIYGEIRVLRGQYDLMGKRFKVLKGKLTFNGGTEYDPAIILEAVHTFRTAAREKQVLRVDVTGKASSPVFAFTLDGQAITEGDAVAILMFGRSLNELTRGQREEIGDEPESKAGASGMAKKRATNMLSGQLTKAVGNTLNLDVVEIKAHDNWQRATFVVGKYLTNDLFMSYEHGFGKSKSGEVEPQTITLEYELARFLFLQLINGDNKASGYDLIFKFEK